MTALAWDVRELCFDEIDEVAGGDFWGQATAVVMIAGGAAGALTAAVAIPATGGIAAVPGAFLAAGGIATMIAGMEKWEEEK